MHARWEVAESNQDSGAMIRQTWRRIVGEGQRSVDVAFRVVGKTRNVLSKEGRRGNSVRSDSDFPATENARKPFRGRECEIKVRSSASADQRKVVGGAL